MPPNFNDNVGPSQFENGPKDQGKVVTSSTGAALKATRSLTTLIAHLLIGIVSGSCLLFAFRSGSTPLNTTNQHIVLCVLGFQFLMAEAILCLAPDSWLSSLNLKHKRWIHTIMQILGSVLALAGCFIMSASKDVNFNTLHGQFALVAIVFTTVCLVNGVASLYAYEYRRVLPPILSKLTHICFGIVALGAACISLGYGFDKNSFRNWATTRLADSLIIMLGALTTIVIINPLIVFSQKFIGTISN